MCDHSLSISDMTLSGFRQFPTLLVWCLMLTLFSSGCIEDSSIPSPEDNEMDTTPDVMILEEPAGEEAGEASQPEMSYISDINEIIACTERSNLDGTINENLTIVARNETRTHALIIYEQEGYYALGGYWENGGFDNPNLTVELHSGVNVGVNYCTDTMITIIVI